MEKPILIPDGNTTLRQMAQSAELFNADMMSFMIEDEKVGGRTFTVAVGFEEAGKYLNELAHSYDEESEIEGSDY